MTTLMKWPVLLTLLVLTLPVTVAQTTQPAQEEISALQLRANTLLTRRDYKAALPLLEELVERLKDQPDKLGPVQELLRACRKNIIAPQDGNPDKVVAAPPDPNDPPTSAEKRIPHPRPEPGKAVELTIKELGNFEYDADKGGNIPDDVKAMDGATLRLSGYMIPMDQADSITQFALVPSLFACCFGQPPQLQHTIIVNTPSGKAVSYSADEIVVEGRLHIEEKKDDGFIVSIFEMECTSVRPSAR